MLNAYHLVLDDGVTDRGLDRGKKEGEGRGVWETKRSCYPTEKPSDFSSPISKSTHCNVSPQIGSPEQTVFVRPNIG